MKILTCIVAVGLLGGCAVWPERAIQPKEPKTEAEYAQRYTDIGVSRKYAHDALKNFKKVSTSAADLERGASYVLYGIGAATGWNIARDRSNGPLTTFALTAATILGIRDVIDPDAQRVILKAGMKALQCALAIDTQVKLIKPTLNTELTNNYGISTFSYDAVSFATLNSSLVMPVAGDPPAKTILRWQLMNYVVNFKNYTQSATALSRLVNVTDASRASGLSEAVDAIIIESIDQLEALTDPTTISDSVRARFKATAGDIVQARKDAEAYRDQLDPPIDDGSGDASTFLGPAQPSLQAIDALIAATKALQETYDACTGGSA